MKSSFRIASLLSCLAFLLATSALTVTVVTTPGCAAIDPGASEIVVNAERTAQAAFEIMDAFVLYEYNNREALRQISPEIEKSANSIRTDGKAAIEQLRAATKAYKNNRNAENKATIDTWIVLVEQFKQTALRFLTAKQTK